MKTRVFLALLLSILIALPAFAQQAGSASTTQASTATEKTAPASYGDTATGQPPLEGPSGDFWDGERPGAVALVRAPFATKKYIQRQVVPIRDRLNELETIATAHSNTTKDIDSRSQHGIQLASEKVTEADQHALDATNKAQMAQQAVSATNTHLSRVETKVTKVGQYKGGVQTVIRFRSGQTVLSKDAKNALDEMATQLKGQNGYVVDLQGFSTSQGQAGIVASREMADSVVRYLVLNHEIPEYRIYAVGLGNASVTGGEGAGTKPNKGNRVEISVLKNDLEQVASGPGSNASSPQK